MLLIIGIPYYFLGHRESKRDIRAYQGDGEIRYIPVNCFMCIDGCTVEMPHLDLSKGIDMEYSLYGIPKGRKYVIYLVVPKPSPHEKVIQGTLSFTIRKDGKTINSMSAKVKDITNGMWSSKNWFYFFGEGYLFVKEDHSPLSLAVKYTNEHLSESTEAYIVIQRSGGK